MVRSLWIGAVVVGLAGTGFVGAQPSSTSQPGATLPQERFISVSEEGRAPQRCKLLKTWRDANGVTSYQVQALDTHELMTLVEAGPAPQELSQRARTRLTRIFRWGRDNQPPDRSLSPPPTATVLGAPLGQPAPRTSSPVTTAKPVPRPVMPAKSNTAGVAAAPQPTPTPAMPQKTAPVPMANVSAPTYPPKTADAAAPCDVTPWRSKPTSVATAPQPTPTPSMPQKTAPAPVANVSAPIFPQPLPTMPPPPPQTSKPSTIVVTSSSGAVGSTVPTTLPTMTPTLLQGPTSQPAVADNQPAAATNASRLVPVVAGTVVTQSPCDPCCQPTCPACCQPSCDCCAPCQPRPSLFSRIFKTNPSPTAVVSKPAPSPPSKPVVSVVKTPTEPARPSDWRESWGKIEPWKGTEQANAEKSDHAPVKRTARAPMPIEPATQPDPLKAPDWYHGMALKEKPAVQEKVAKKEKPAVKEKPAGAPTTEALARFAPQPVEYKPALVQNVPGPLPATPPGDKVDTAAKPGPSSMPPASPSKEASVPSPIQPRGRAVEMAATDSNAFWTPPEPPQTIQAPKYNAFERDGNSPPRPPMGIAPPLSGISMGAPPMGPMGPMAMMPTPPRPPVMPPMVDSGVPEGMANAFTMSSTRRPIPADFGPTPQEPNGFGDVVPYTPTQGPAVPPQDGMSPARAGMPGYPNYPMPNMMGMTPRGPVMAINPLMAVPPTPLRLAAPGEPAGAASMPQMMVALKESLYPSQREMVAEQLSELNWRLQPQVVESLTKAAREDPAATVRAACIRALAHMKANTLDVVAVVQDLKNDRDPRVRHEADEALNTFGVAAAPVPDSGVRPVSHH